MNLSEIAFYICVVTIVMALTIIVFVHTNSGRAEIEPTIELTEGTLPEPTEASTTPETTEPAIVPVETTEPTEPVEEPIPEPTEPETEPTEPPTEPEPTEPPVMYFDVPLSHDLQDHIFSLCEQYDINPRIIIAMIRKESTYNPENIGDNGNSYGLMQIQPRWHQERMNKLGCNDLLNPYQNVWVGIDYLAEMMSWGGSIEYALMAYNAGPSYASELVAEGRVSYYARTVLQYAEELKYED